MPLIGGSLGYALLKQLDRGRHGEGQMDGSAYLNRSKIEVLLGADFWSRIRDRVVIDFGCGTGHDAVEMAQKGARRVIGIDIQERMLQVAEASAAAAGVADRCTFATTTTERADVIVSLDAFEHFEDPAAILRIMAGLLAPGGEVIAAFGPTWYHPLGGHLFSVVPWAHLVFTESALIRWRSDFKTDGATRFSEVAGGLNQMTIARFERLVAASPLRFTHFEAVPIRRLAWAANRLTREWTTAIVRCRLARREEPLAA
ncbi:MAG TPA: class I SAM-dependent methyltransferase [Gemmatimonadaceae bacterium]|nr:class I SAM-dependent methyltransferase [Gemmatimonadaceae bacterium]